MERLAGKPALKHSKHRQQRLLPAEENTLVELAYQLDAWGWPMTVSTLNSLAKSLLEAKGDLDPLGHNWYLAFMRRHPELKVRRSQAMDQARRDALDKKTIDHWFELFNALRLIYNVSDDDTYNMGEKGCMKGVGERVNAIIPLPRPENRKQEAFSAQAGNREWVSIIECISANGFFLPPFVIFEGERIGHGWTDETIDKKIQIRVSPKGWTDHGIALEWLHHFNKHTQGRTRGESRLLVLDGHSSHVSIEFVRYCKENKIVALCPPRMLPGCSLLMLASSAPWQSGTGPPSPRSHEWGLYGSRTSNSFAPTKTPEPRSTPVISPVLGEALDWFLLTP